MAYVGVYIYAPQDRSVILDAPDMIELRLGADGGTKALLNGTAIGRFDFVRELVLDADRMPGLPLRKGWELADREAAQFLRGLAFCRPAGDGRAGEPATDLDVAVAPSA